MMEYWSSNIQDMGCNNHPEGVIILCVYIHCEGCGDQVLRCLGGFDGVEGVEIDAKHHKVIVKGENADPVKVAERLRKKSGKYVQLLHPQPVQQEKIEKPPKRIEVVLKINIHCEGCAKEVKHCIHNMEGVETVDVDMKKNRVVVKGSMDAQKLVEYISKRGGRYAEIEKQTPKESSSSSSSCYCYDSHQVYAPQFFSDENPNSCSLM